MTSVDVRLQGAWAGVWLWRLSLVPGAISTVLMFKVDRRVLSRRPAQGNDDAYIRCTYARLGLCQAHFTSGETEPQELEQKLRFYSFIK